MDPLQPRVISDAGNMGNAELLTEVLGQCRSCGYGQFSYWSELTFQQHCVLESHPCLAGRQHLPALGLGSISGSYSVNST